MCTDLSPLNSKVLAKNTDTQRETEAADGTLIPNGTFCQLDTIHSVLAFMRHDKQVREVGSGLNSSIGFSATAIGPSTIVCTTRVMWHQGSASGRLTVNVTQIGSVAW